MIRPTLARLAALAIAVCAILPAAARPAAAEDGGALASAWAAAAAKDWAGADALAARSGPIAVDLVLWQRLRAGQGTWPEYRDFAARNPDWPGMDLLVQRGDATLRRQGLLVQCAHCFSKRATSLQ